MNKNRMEAFSDGVFAIIITIMVLEMKVPQGTTLEALRPLLPVFLGYVLSFVYVAIYWNNHHHLLQAARQVKGPILWANTHLLFWLSLLPFVTHWMGESGFAGLPVFLYSIVMFMAAIAYFLLSRTLVAHHGADSTLGQAVGRDSKGMVSLAAYGLALPLAFPAPWAAVAIIVGVAILWVIPDRRIERRLES
jgi:uncharacterized membrane protein